MATIFIYGKIEDKEGETKDTFNKIETDLKNKGHIVRNPLRLIKDDLSFSAYFREILKIMLECESIYLVPGWESSIKARTIYEIANSLQMHNFLSHNYIAGDGNRLNV